MVNLTTYLRPQVRSNLGIWLPGTVLLVAGIGLSVLAYRQSILNTQLTARNDKLVALQSKAAPPVASLAAQEDMRRWAQLKLDRDFPWTPVFRAVEKVASPDIELLQFKPDKLNRRISLGGEAKSHQALVAYLDALSMQPGVKNAYLAHQQTVARDTLETFSFEIRATLAE